MKARVVGIALFAGCIGPGVDKDPPLTEDPCEAATPVADGGLVDSHTVRWSYNPNDGLSLGETVAVELAEDVMGLAITIDGGEAQTGVASLIIDGTTLLDWTGSRGFNDPARRRRGRRGRPSRRGALDTSWDSADTGWWDSGWDSGWDTGWDSGDSGGLPPGDGWGSHPFFHYPEVAGTVVMPMNLDTSPWPGCMLVTPAAIGNLDGISGEVLIAAKRSPDTARNIAINLILVDGAGISDADLTDAIERMQAVYEGATGPILAEITRFEVNLPGGPFVEDSGATINDLRATIADPGLDTESLNLFFIADFLGSGGTLGIAAGIPGAFVQGTAGSGVTMSVDAHKNVGGDVDTTLLGETMAHEVGHQLGLFHTTEAGGDSHDVIDDTPECRQGTYDSNGDGELTAEECEDADGANFMFWTAGDSPQDGMTATQALVLNRSPLAY